MKASVIIITYNQENFIASTIEGIMMQKTNFDFEVIIGEDCSTDNTGKICEDYFHKYSNKIKLLSNKKNKGIVRNLLESINESKGEYVAICGGDDYWIDP